MKRHADGRIVCPYLDTVNRERLDFDQDFQCSVSLLRHSVYSCLVCGRFFAGRGRGSPAQKHALETGHRVFVHLTHKTFHCLPEDYEVVDAGLDDIKAAIDPVFTAEKIQELEGGMQPAGGGAPVERAARDVHGGTYLPGFVGMNNLGGTDWLNAVVQVLLRVSPLRHHLLLGKERPQEGSAGAGSRSLAVCTSFGALARKMCADSNFRAARSPVALLLAIGTASKNRFASGRPADAAEFLSWMLNHLHAGLRASKQRQGKGKSGVVARALRGKVRVIVEDLRAAAVEGPLASGGTGENATWDDAEGGTAAGGAPGDEGRAAAIVPATGAERMETVTTSNFFMLSVDLPEAALSEGTDGVARVALGDLLRKYDGSTWTDGQRGQRRRYELERLPPFVFVTLKRFRRSSVGGVEKNGAIVALPIEGFDIGAHVGIPGEAPGRPLYNLVASIGHESPPGREGNPLLEGSYRAYVRAVGDRWFEIHDTHVRRVMPQQIAISECYIALYEAASTA